MRKSSDNKKKYDCEDMMSLVYALDECSVSLPTYVSADLSCVPSVSPREVYVFALATTVASLSEQLNNVRKRLEKAEAAVTVKPGEFLSSCRDATGSDTVAKPADEHSSRTTPPLASAAQSWADTAMTGEWKLVQPPKKLSLIHI